MADNVVALRGGAEANQDLVNGLEQLLSLARAGTIQGLAYAVARRDHAWITGFACTLGYNGTLAAGMLVLPLRYGAHLQDQPEADPL